MMGDTFRAIYRDLKAERDAQNREDEFVEWLNKAADEMSAINYFSGAVDHKYCPEEGACYVRTFEFHGEPPTVNVRSNVTEFKGMPPNG